jgi:hypothetical protein
VAVKEIEKLTIRERKFFEAYLRTGKQITAFQEAFPNSKLKKPDVAACKLMRRIKDKHDWERLLEEAGLGFERIYTKLEELLEATTVKHYKDKEVGIYTDNATRIRALELLVDLHGLRKQVLEHTGNITFTEAIQEAYRRRQQLHIVKDENVSNG